jgi:hypothetical protein
MAMARQMAYAVLIVARSYRYARPMHLTWISCGGASVRGASASRESR